MPGPAATAPCGTVSAYKRHLRHGEPADDACKAAWATYHRNRYDAPSIVKPARNKSVDKPSAETNKEKNPK